MTTIHNIRPFNTRYVIRDRSSRYTPELLRTHRTAQASYAYIIVRIVERLSTARHTQIVETLNGRQVPANWTAASEDRKLLRFGMRSTMRMATFRSLYPINR